MKTRKSKNKQPVTEHAPMLSLAIGIMTAMIGTFLVWPKFDLAMSGIFYVEGQGFPLANNGLFMTLQNCAFYGARVMGVFFLIVALYCLWRSVKIATIPARGWFFLLLALLVGPGLVTNVILKDHWGRARPREIVEFGGAKQFTPLFVVPAADGQKNSSFPSGDASFGFFLPAIAYLVPQKRSRRTFWGLVGIGSVFAFARLAMGAHFTSDILVAIAITLCISAAIHALLYGHKATAERWRGWFSW